MNNKLCHWSLIAIALATGCAFSTPAVAAEGWSLGKSWNKLWNPEPKDKKHAYQSPTRIVAIWSPAMYNIPGKPPTRGYGGRIYFYNEKDQPVPVDGQLVVYGFNDSVQRADGRQPDRKFVFTSKQLSSHYSPGELGASYSVWIPWDAVGGQQLEISLLPVFTGTSGQVVMGEQSRNLLPGTTTPPMNPQHQQSTVQPFIIDHRVAPASYAAPHDPGNNALAIVAEQSFYTHATAPAPQENIRTTSIQLTPGMAERLIQERLQQQPLQPSRPPTNVYPNDLPTTTYPLPAGSMPPNMTSAPPQPATRSFNAPTADSRAWGPTLARMQGPQGSLSPRSQPPAALTQGSTPVGQSPTRYAPGSLPVPVTAGPQPTSYQQPTAPGPAVPGSLPPSPSQSVPYLSAPAGWHNAPAGAR